MAQSLSLEDFQKMRDVLREHDAPGPFFVDIHESHLPLPKGWLERLAEMGIHVFSPLRALA